MQRPEVSPQPTQRLRCRRRAEHDHALAAVLGLVHAQRLAPGVEGDVAHAQGQDLAGAHARLAQDGDEEPVGPRRRGDGGVEGALLAVLARAV